MYVYIYGLVPKPRYKSLNEYAAIRQVCVGYTSICGVRRNELDIRRAMSQAIFKTWLCGEPFFVTLLLCWEIGKGERSIYFYCHFHVNTLTVGAPGGQGFIMFWSALSLNLQETWTWDAGLPYGGGLVLGYTWRVNAISGPSVHTFDIRRLCARNTCEPIAWQWTSDIYQTDLVRILPKGIW